MPCEDSGLALMDLEEALVVGEGMGVLVGGDGELIVLTFSEEKLASRYLKQLLGGKQSCEGSKG